MADAKKEGFFDKIKILLTGKEEQKTPVTTADRYRPRVESFTEHHTLHVFSYDGEKNFGEVGPIKDLRPNHAALSMRSWQAFLESEIAQTIINRFSVWVIGTGLKLQSEPPTTIFKDEGINLNVQDFSRLTEAKWNIFRKAKWADYSNMRNLDAIAKEAFKNAKVSGDVLTVLRYENGQVNVQLIDGCHIMSPNFSSSNISQPLSNGNTIRNGVETDSRGRHIAYHVRLANLQYKRIEALSTESGLQTAFLVYGSKYRLNNVRGIPLISTVIESLKKMERYKDATLGSAEERAKIAYFFEHGIASDGENPMVRQFSRALDVDGTSASDLPKDVNATDLANTVAATTNKQVFNMPRDSRVKSMETKQELYFKDFFDVNVAHVCAAIGIPVQVAMSMYDGNFSASRAALKDWENTLVVERKDFSDQFDANIFAFWLDIQILKGKLSAPGYILARKTNDVEILQAYRTARFVGASVPHIDPWKEVKAEREKLGTAASHIPLTTFERSTERLDDSEASSNFAQFAQELEDAENLGIEAPVVGSGNVDEFNGPVKKQED